MKRTLQLLFSGCNDLPVRVTQDVVVPYLSAHRLDVISQSSVDPVGRGGTLRLDVLRHYGSFCSNTSGLPVISAIQNM